MNLKKGGVFDIKTPRFIMAFALTNRREKVVVNA